MVSDAQNVRPISCFDFADSVYVPSDSAPPCREQDYDDIDEEDPFNPRARRIGSQNPNLTNMHSFCSYSSSLGSQNSLQPPAPPPAVSNTGPMSEYMYVK